MNNKPTVLTWTNVLLAFFLIGIVYGCVPYRKTILLRDKNSQYKDTIPTSLKYYRLGVNDILSIQISSFNKSVSEFYNLKNDGGIGGFLIHENGYVHIPQLDSMFVLGKTVPEVEGMISIKLKEQINDPYVVVRLVNFKIIFLGEIGRPGVIQVQENSINILEALALAGNITEMGNNSEVKLVRKKDNGTTYITMLDLTAKDIIASPYYYLQPNDVIYIQPLKVRNFRNNFQLVATILSLTTFVLVIGNFIISARQ